MGRKRNTGANSAPAKVDTKSVVRTMVVAPNNRGVADIGKWRSAIKSADRGRVRQLYELFDDLMLDGVLSDAIDKRIKAVINANFSFYNAKGETVDRVVNEIIDSSGFEELIRSLMMSEVYGRGGAELSVNEKGLHVTDIPAQHIDLQNKQVIPDLMKWETGVSYEGLTHVIIAGKERDYGLMVKAAQYAIYKRGGFGDWSQWIEIFGMPQRIGKYHANDPEGKKQILQALHEMGSCSYLATPYETDIEVKDTQKGSGVAYNDFRKALNEEILITILGQTLTTVAGDRGARALGDVHMDVEQSKNKSDIRFVTRLLNERLVPFLEARGYAEASGGYFSTPSEVEETSVDDIVKLSGIIPIPTTYIYDRYGIPKPAEGEEVAGTRQAELPSEPVDQSDKSDDPKAPHAPNDKPSKKKLRDFFVEALTAAQGSLKNWTNSITTLAANDNSVGFDVQSLVLEALRQLHKGEYEDAVEQLFSANDLPLQRGLDMVFDTADDDLFPFVEEFKYNTSVFNAFKTHAEMNVLHDALTDDEGNLRSFRQFRKAVEPIIGRYNVHWLQTEYNTAVRAADAAKYYQEALRTKHIFPNLEYLESKAKDKREDHREWVGTTLPIEHPWWDTHLPPSAWNCQCTVKKTRKPVTGVPPEVNDDMPGVLQQNPGKSASPFKLSEHPYLKGKGQVTCPECRRQGLVNDRKLGDEESQLCPIHRLGRKLFARLRQTPLERVVASREKTKRWMEKTIEPGQWLFIRLPANEVAEEMQHGRKGVKAALSKGHNNPIGRDWALRNLNKVMGYPTSRYVGWAEDEILPNGTQKHPDVDYWIYFETKYGYANVKVTKSGEVKFYCFDEERNPNIQEGTPSR